MVTVEKDERKWVIRLELTNDVCPYVFYPINIHACNHPSLNRKPHSDYLECTLENCPARVSISKKELDELNASQEDTESAPRFY